MFASFRKAMCTPFAFLLFGNICECSREREHKVTLLLKCAQKRSAEKRKMDTNHREHLSICKQPSAWQHMRLLQSKAQQLNWTQALCFE